MPNRGRDDFSLEQVAFVQALHRVHQVRQVQVRVARPVPPCDVSLVTSDDVTLVS